MKLKKTDVLEKSLEELHCVIEAYRDNFHTTAYTPADYDFLIYNLKLHTKKLVGELKKKRRQAKKAGKTLEKRIEKEAL